MQQHLDPHEGGVRKGDLPSAWAVRINILLARSAGWGLSTVVAFIDIAKAFASVEHRFLFIACQDIGISAVWLKLFEVEINK